MGNKIQINKSKIEGRIHCPPSKSYTHRSFSIASLALGKSIIKNPLLSRDTLATLNGCKALGVQINEKNDNIEINGKTIFDTPLDVINAENSGTTIRLLSSMCALVNSGYSILTGDSSLRKRPMKPLTKSLSDLGVECFSTNALGTPPIVIKGGGIKGGTTTIEGNISSQFVSSLLISCIYAHKDVTILINGDQVSKPYIVSTIETMKCFGVTLDLDSYSRYFVTNNSYKPTTFTIPGDFSSAALLLTAGALVGDDLIIDGLNFDLPQGDMKIIDILKEIGADIVLDKQKGEIRIRGSDKFDGLDCNLQDCPDLLPAVAILSLKSRSKITISGIGHARFKETDRVHNIAKEISKLGVKVKEEQDYLVLTPPDSINNNTILQSYNDHRLFMAFSIAGMLTNKTIIDGLESVDVSYPDFFNSMVKIGALFYIYNEH